MPAVWLAGTRTEASKNLQYNVCGVTQAIICLDPAIGHIAVVRSIGVHKHHKFAIHP
jgi:hypothetical protein